MTRAHRLLLTMLPLALALTACSDHDPQARVDALDSRDRQAQRKAEDEERAAIGGIEANVRLRTLQTRVDALDQEVGALKNTRQALDLDLLNQRLAALEAKVAAADATPPALIPKPGATPKPSPTPRPTARATPKPNVTG